MNTEGLFISIFIIAWVFGLGICIGVALGGHQERRRVREEMLRFQTEMMSRWRIYARREAMGIIDEACDERLTEIAARRFKESEFIH